MTAGGWGLCGRVSCSIWNGGTAPWALRLPGWMAQWKEQRETPGGKIGRPRQIYVGETLRSVPDLGAQ